MEDRRFRKALLAWTAAVAAAFAVCYFYIDRPLALWSRQIEGSWEQFWSFATRAGESTAWLVLLAIGWLACFWTGRRIWGRRCAFLFAAIAISGIAVNILRFIAGRYRPHSLFTKNLFGFDLFRLGWHYNSFPSGHACTAGALCTALWLIAPKFKPLWVPLFAFIAVTRVMTQSHFLSDVIVGSFLGVVVTLLIERWMQRRGIHVRPARQRDVLADIPVGDVDGAMGKNLPKA